MQLKEILKAAGKLTGESEFFVIGTAAILQIFESPARESLSRSIEADLIPLSGDPEVADSVSIAIGELSPFHDNHGVYADGLTFEAPRFAPKDWQARAIRRNYADIGVAARFMELHDLTLSKLGAGRAKDLEFCEALAATGYLSRDRLVALLDEVDCDPPVRALIEARIGRIFRESGSVRRP